MGGTIWGLRFPLPWYEESLVAELDNINRHSAGKMGPHGCPLAAPLMNPRYAVCVLCANKRFLNVRDRMCPTQACKRRDDTRVGMTVWQW